jgi:hypothetical protein
MVTLQILGGRKEKIRPGRRAGRTHQRRGRARLHPRADWQDPGHRVLHLRRRGARRGHCRLRQAQCRHGSRARVCGRGCYSDPQNGGAWGPNSPPGRPKVNSPPRGGGQRPAKRWSVGAKFTAGPPQGEFAPSGGGQRPARRRSVGALSVGQTPTCFPVICRLQFHDTVTTVVSSAKPFIWRNDATGELP